jgi:hypothetical protein
VRQAAAILLTGLLAASILAPVLPWMHPCIVVSRLEPCKEERRAGGPMLPSSCISGACDWYPSIGAKAERILVPMSLLLMAGMIAALLNQRAPRRASALSGAVAVMFTLLADRFLYGYGTVAFVEVVISALPIGLGAAIAWCGGWLASALSPNKTMEPTR